MAKSVLDVEEARRRTADGLRLCLAGDEAAGIARYQGCCCQKWRESWG